MKGDKTIPLQQGLHLYWRYLIPVFAMPTVIAVVLVFLDMKWAMIITLPFYLWALHYSAIPCLKHGAGYSFRFFTVGMCWVSLVLGGLVSGVIKWIME